MGGSPMGDQYRSEEKAGSRSFSRTISDIFLRKIVMTVRSSSLMFSRRLEFQKKSTTNLWKAFHRRLRPYVDIHVTVRFREATGKIQKKDRINSSLIRTQRPKSVYRGHGFE
jgi:hypothetical protein